MAIGIRASQRCEWKAKLNRHEIGHARKEIRRRGIHDATARNANYYEDYNLLSVVSLDKCDSILK